MIPAMVVTGRNLASASTGVLTMALVLAAPSLGAGCYEDTINTRPVATIRVVSGSPDGMVYLDDPPPQLSADPSTDADGDPIDFFWELRACPGGVPCPSVGTFARASFTTTREVTLKPGEEPVRVVVPWGARAPRGAVGETVMVSGLETRKPVPALTPLPENRLNRHHAFSVG